MYELAASWGVSPHEPSVLEKIRSDNAIDYVLLVKHLASLLVDYGSQEVRNNPQRKAEVVEALLIGISADPSLFTHPDLLSSSLFLPFPEMRDGRLKRYFDELRKQGGLLAEDWKAFDPAQRAYSPLGRVSNFSSDFIQKMVFRHFTYPEYRSFTLEQSLVASDQKAVLDWSHTWGGTYAPHFALEQFQRARNNLLAYVAVHEGGVPAMSHESNLAIPPVEASANPSLLWQKALRDAIDRGDRRPYLEIEPESVSSAVEGPRTTGRQRGSLEMDAKDLLYILPPLPQKASLIIKSNRPDRIELESRGQSPVNRFRAEKYLGLILTRHGDGTPSHPFEVHIEEGSIGAKAIIRHLQEKSAPHSEFYESPSFILFSRLTEWLKGLPWGGPAWFVVPHIIDGCEDLFRRLRWQRHPLYKKGKRISISNPLSKVAAAA